MAIVTNNARAVVNADDAFIVHVVKCLDRFDHIDISFVGENFVKKGHLAARIAEVGKEDFALAAEVADGFNNVHVDHSADRTHAKAETVVGAGHGVYGAL